ncbi:MAG: MlaD family protein [Planctomycetota bacterium]|jgi:phospholipid/cholesterol/gamma-HCH transport system substrate-binding protein
MTEMTRNLAVGFTVLVALALLGGMILLFTGLPEVFQPGYTIRITASTTYDAYPGDSIHMSGMRIGRIREINFTDPENPHEGVTFIGRIKRGIKLPANARAHFFTKGIAGTTYLELKGDGAPRKDPATGKVLEFFPTDGSIAVDALRVGGGLDSPQMTRAAESFTELTEKLITSAEKLSQLITTLNQAATKIESGDGTAGKLLNDPELYNNFLATTRQMNQLLEEVRQLVKTWKTEGVELKVK